MVFVPRVSVDKIGWGSKQVPSEETSSNGSEKPCLNDVPTKKASKRKNSPEHCQKKKKCERKKSNGSNIEKHDSNKNYNATYGCSISFGFQQGVNVKTIDDGNVPYSIVTFELTTDSSKVFLVGRAKVLAIEGDVDIFGFTLTSASQKAIVVDSPNWSSSLSISSLKKGNKSVYAKIKVISIDEKTFSYQLLPKNQIQSPIIFDERWNTAVNNILNEVSADKLCEEQSGKNRVLICGAKNVGKSTFAKYICNRILSINEFETVALLDCDVGQPELSPPGLLSLTILSKPLICPAHVHMICGNEVDIVENEQYSTVGYHQSAIYYGATASKINPVSYIEALRELMNDYDALSKNNFLNIPLIVNTNGWVKGMGFEILSSVIDIVNPGHIAQIIGSTRAKFFDLSSHTASNRAIHVVASQSISKKEQIQEDLLGSPPLSRTTSTASLQTIDQDTKFDAKDISISPSLLRNVRMCVYFAGGYRSFLETGATFQKTGIVDDACRLASKLARMKPYIVPFDAVTCVLMDEDGNNNVYSSQNIGDIDHIYDVFNGSVVGLCKDAKISINIHSCIGLGIVRSIDRINRLYYILTPLPAEKLQNHVTKIVRGQSQMPLECIFRGQNAESFPFQSCDDLALGSGEVLRSSTTQAQNQ